MEQPTKHVLSVIEVRLEESAFYLPEYFCAETLRCSESLNHKRAKSPAIVVPLMYIFVYLLALYPAQAQRMQIYNHALEQPLLINPATAGAQAPISFQVNSVHYWWGIEGAPVSNIANIQVRAEQLPGISKTAKKRLRGVGLGLAAYQDNNGLLSYQGLQFAYAFHIDMKTSMLSFGIAAKYIQSTLNKAALRPYSNNDPLLLQSNSLLRKPDTQFGVRYSTKQLTLSVSVVDLLKAPLRVAATSSRLPDNSPDVFVLALYSLPLSTDWSITASLLGNSIELPVFSFTQALGINYRNTLDVTIAYRYREAWVSKVGLQIKKLKMGYLYEYTSGGVMQYNLGSHGVFMGWNIHSLHYDQ